MLNLPPHQLTQIDATRVKLNNSNYTYYGGYDYLALAQDVQSITIAIEALRSNGLGAGASRITSGERPVYRKLEVALAAFLATEDAAILPSGSLSNLALIETIGGELSRWLVDARAHPSFMSAARGSHIETYNHLDHKYFREKLFTGVRTTFLGVFTDSIFSLSGTIAPLKEILRAIRDADQKAVVVVDEAHSLGVLGKTGRGILEHLGVTPYDSQIEIVLTGTMSKAIGSFGGYVAGSFERIDQLRSSSSAYRTSSPLPPFLAEVALANLHRVEADHSMISELRRNVMTMKSLLKPFGLSTTDTLVPIFSLEDGPRFDVKKIAQTFLSRGILIPFVDGYSSNQPTSILRWIVNRAHTKGDLAKFGQALRVALG
jgi:8-amino-7-oxononanoate synthase